MAKEKPKAKKKTVKKAVKKVGSASPIATRTATKKIAAKKKKVPPVKKKKATKKRKPETLMCFLTTACVNYYNLPDNCYELTTLRKYRDTYLAASSGGKELILEYYAIAPKIVTLANEDKEKKSVYKYIYAQVQKACEQIEKNYLLSAKKTYINLVNTLIRRYELN